MLFFSILLIQNIFSQESVFKIQARKDSVEFHEMLRQFNSLSVNEPNNGYSKIPFRIYYKFFREKYDERVTGISPIQVLNNSKNITLIVEEGYPEGGHSCNYKLATFKPNGDLMLKTNICGVGVDLDGGFTCEMHFIDNKFLEILEYQSKNVNDIYKVTGEIQHNYYFINQNGYRMIVPEYSGDRLFPNATTRILNENELFLYSVEQLDIMRNEIFADYGYKFKIEKWKKYFESKKWYVPRHEDVNEFLSEIEKYNIDLILKVKENKE